MSKYTSPAKTEREETERAWLDRECYNIPYANKGTLPITVGHGACFKCVCGNMDYNNKTGCHHNWTHYNCVTPVKVNTDSPAIPEDLT